MKKLFAVLTVCVLVFVSGCAAEKPIAENKEKSQPNKNVLMGTLLIIGGILIIALFVALVASQL